MTAVSSLADACPSPAHHPGDLPAVVPHDVTAGCERVLARRVRVPGVRAYLVVLVGHGGGGLAPTPQPPCGHRIGPRAELLEDFAELRSWGVSVDEAAARLGVTQGQRPGIWRPCGTRGPRVRSPEPHGTAGVCPAMCKAHTPGPSGRCLLVAATGASERFPVPWRCHPVQPNLRTTGATR